MPQNLGSLLSQTPPSVLLLLYWNFQIQRSCIELTQDTFYFRWFKDCHPLNLENVWSLNSMFLSKCWRGCHVTFSDMAYLLFCHCSRDSAPYQTCEEDIFILRTAPDGQKIHLGPYSPTFLQNDLSLVLQILLYLVAFECKTTSNWLNHSLPEVVLHANL